MGNCCGWPRHSDIYFTTPGVGVLACDVTLLGGGLHGTPGGEAERTSPYTPEQAVCRSQSELRSRFSGVHILGNKCIAASADTFLVKHILVHKTGKR